MANSFRKWKSLYSSTTNSFGTGEGETITPSSVSGLPTDTEIVLTFDREVDGKLERILGTISGGNFVVSSGGRGYDGTTEQSHTSPTVEHVPNGADINDLVDGLLVGHTQTGAHDLNGAEIILDADGDTSLTADTDDRIDVKLSGTDRYRFGTSDFDLVQATSNIQVAGADPKRGIYVPAQGMFAATTSGAASAQLESSTNKVNTKVFDFDKDTDEFVHFAIPSPLYWDASTVTAQFYWTTAGTTGNVIWGCQGVALADSDPLDTAYGTAQTVTDGFLLASDVHVSSATSAITIAGSPVAGEWVQFRIYRDADNGSDTLDADARLMGVRISFGISQYNDA